MKLKSLIFSLLLTLVLSYQQKQPNQNQPNQAVQNLPQVDQPTDQAFPPNDWMKISKCDVTLFAPKTLNELKNEMIDICAASFENSNLRIDIQYGWHIPKFEKDKSKLNFEEEYIEIEGRKTQLVTFISKEKEVKKSYMAGIYVEFSRDNDQVMINKLGLLISGKSENDLQTAKQIFKTIKFQD